MRKLLSMLALFVVGLLTLSMVSASVVEDSLKIVGVQINDEDANVYTTADVDGSNVDNLAGEGVDEGETLIVEVDLEAVGTIENVQVSAELYGYEYDDYENLEAESHTFDMRVSGNGSTSKSQELEIQLPNKLDNDRYLLKISVDAQDITPLVRYVVLQIEPARHGIEITDVTFSPSTTLKAGRSLLTTVLLQNYGYGEQKDVKVTVAIPELGVSASEFVDVVATDNHNVEYEDVPEMFLPIPADAKEGEYDVKVTVKYDEYEVATKTFKIKVLANEAYQVSDKLVLAVGPEAQTVAAGTSATYAIALTNAGSASKAYLLEGTAGSDWATLSLSDSLVVLAPGQNKVVYVEAKVAAAATAGSHVASVAIKSGSEVLQTVAFQANVVAAAAPAAVDTSYNLRNGLEIALIVLVVVLVIVGLIVGFSRLKKDDEEGKNYY